MLPSILRGGDACVKSGPERIVLGLVDHTRRALRDTQDGGRPRPSTASLFRTGRQRTPKAVQTF